MKRGTGAKASVISSQRSRRVILTKRAGNQNDQDEDGAESAKNNEALHSFAGPLFRQRMRDDPSKPWNDTDNSWMQRLPIVEVSAKVEIVTDVNVADQTFRCMFLLYLEWFDASIRTSEEAAAAVRNHFVPFVSFENDVDEVQTVGDSEVRQGDFVGHMKFLRKYVGTFRSRANVQDYPFDHQFLNIVVKSRRVMAPDGESTAKVVLFNPLRFQTYGHRIADNSDWLAEWMLVSIRGANFREIDRNYKYFDQYMLQIEVKRESLNTNINSAFVIFVVTLLSNSAFAIGVDDLADRISLDLTAFLTVVAFKWIISASLPKVPYMTTLDVYIFLSFVNFFVQGMYFFGAAVAFESLECDSATLYDLGLNISQVAGSTGFIPIQDDVDTGFRNCAGIALADWIMTVLSLLLVTGSQVYYITMHSRAAQHSAFRAIDGLLDSIKSHVGVSAAAADKVYPTQTPAARLPSETRKNYVETRFNFNYDRPYLPEKGPSPVSRKYDRQVSLTDPGADADRKRQLVDSKSYDKPAT